MIIQEEMDTIKNGVLAVFRDITSHENVSNLFEKLPLIWGTYTDNNKQDFLTSVPRFMMDDSISKHIFAESIRALHKKKQFDLILFMCDAYVASGKTEEGEADLNQILSPSERADRQEAIVFSVETVNIIGTIAIPYQRDTDNNITFKEEDLIEALASRKELDTDSLRGTLTNLMGL